VHAEAARVVNPARPPLVSILLFSAAGLAYEVLLMRLFSIVHWHHFAYMIISIALLGFGASGTFIAIAQTRSRGAYRTAYLANGAAFAVATFVCFVLAQRIPFNTLEILWDPTQWALLGAIYVVLALPFFFLANLLALSLQRFDADIGRVYGADLAGAGIGAASIVALLYVLHPAAALKVVTTMAVIAWSIARVETHAAQPKRWGAAAVAALAALWLLPPVIAQPAMTPYKGLPTSLLVPGTRIVGERSSPLALLSVVESPEVPFRYAPGMSLTVVAGIPPQLGVFSDGDGFSPVSHYGGDAAELAYLDALTSALPYHLVAQPRTLIVGANGDAILQAVGGGATQVDAVEINSDRIAVLDTDYAGFYGWSYLSPRVRLREADLRAWLLDEPATYDLIVFPLDESSAAAAAGVHGLMEEFLFTTEALSLYWSHLSARGALVVTRWVKLPPRDEFKLVNAAIDVLTALRIDAAREHIVLIRGWKTTTLLLTRRPVEPARAEVVRRFADARSFDVDYCPGVAANAAKRFNRLTLPHYEDGLRALLGDRRADFVQTYPFDIAPATDDRPYFFQFFRWSSLPTIMRLRDVGGLGLFEWGYPVLVMTLFQAIIASAVLIVAPLLLRADRRQTTGGSWVVAYFALVGVAFMFVEMAFIQRMTLLLHHPVNGVAAALGSILVFAGLGSRYGQHLADRLGPTAIIRRAALALAVLLLLYRAALPALFDVCAGLPAAAKLLVGVLVIAPPALLMGMPFAMGLLRLARTHPGAVPWAWCINGCTSVVSAVVATLVAVHAGFSAVFVTAALMYAMVALIGGRSRAV
jgi:hypothetical protein